MVSSKVGSIGNESISEILIEVDRGMLSRSSEDDYRATLNELLSVSDFAWPCVPPYAGKPLV